VSGCGVMTLTTLHLPASKPAAMTRSTTSLLVKIPAILGTLAAVPAGAFSMTQTAVTLCSFMSLATSLTVALGPTIAGWVRESIIVVKSGSAVFSRNASTYASMALAWGFDVIPPSSDWTPARALYSFSEAVELRSTLSTASWKTLVISSRPTTFPSSLHTG